MMELKESVDKLCEHLESIEESLAALSVSGEASTKISRSLSAALQLLSQMKPAIHVHVPAPIVNNNVSPTPVVMQATVKAPEVRFMPADQKGATWRIQSKKTSDGMESTVTRVA